MPPPNRLDSSHDEGVDGRLGRSSRPAASLPKGGTLSLLVRTGRLGAPKGEKSSLPCRRGGGGRGTLGTRCFAPCRCGSPLPHISCLFYRDTHRRSLLEASHCSWRAHATHPLLPHPSRPRMAIQHTPPLRRACLPAQPRHQRRGAFARLCGSPGTLLGRPLPRVRTCPTPRPGSPHEHTAHRRPLSIPLSERPRTAPR